MRSRRLPARLIEISHDPGHEKRLRAKLVTPVFQNGLQYVCLSHRRGEATSPFYSFGRIT